MALTPRQRYNGPDESNEPLTSSEASGPLGEVVPFGPLTAPHSEPFTPKGEIESASAALTSHGTPMSDQTRDELIDKKIEIVELRLETRLVGIEAKIDRVLDRVDIAVEAAQRAQKASERAEDRADEAKRAASNIKWNILFTAVGVAAVLLAAWAIWVQGMELVAGLISAFEAQQ